ncbi:uncharacterized protein Dvar_11470 [Desulfosarcina variabilis str. Montpellier]|uniref:hypothetical protein n=1 Tax=Desulfosarcina variabilis TaxID=2300 RepID=UPI003AFAE0DC
MKDTLLDIVEILELTIGELDAMGGPTPTKLSGDLSTAWRCLIDKFFFTSKNGDGMPPIDRLLLQAQSAKKAYRQVADAVTLLEIQNDELPVEDEALGPLLNDVHGYLLAALSHLVQGHINADTGDDESDIDRIRLQAQCAEESSVMLDDAINKLGVAHAAFVKARRHLRGNHLDPVTLEPMTD